VREIESAHYNAPAYQEDECCEEDGTREPVSSTTTDKHYNCETAAHITLLRGGAVEATSAAALHSAAAARSGSVGPPFTPLRLRAADPSVGALPLSRPRAEDLSLRVLPPRPPLTWVAPVWPLDPPPALAADPSTPAIGKMGKMGNGGDGDA
jgi:hypothetical protein